jgi:signal peptidase I
MSEDAQQRLTLGCELVADVARRFGEVRLRATGCSMVPAVWPGDEITVRRCELAELKPGQIALCMRDGALVAHRVRRVEDDFLIMRGDALPFDDAPMSASDVVGQVVRVVRNGRDVELRRSAVQMLGAAMARRSTFLLRMMVRAGRSMDRIGGREISWES